MFSLSALVSFLYLFLVSFFFVSFAEKNRHYIISLLVCQSPKIDSLSLGFLLRVVFYFPLPYLFFSFFLNVRCFSQKFKNLKTRTPFKKQTTKQQSAYIMFSKKYKKVQKTENKISQNTHPLT
jgi:hypothetical protein